MSRLNGNHLILGHDQRGQAVSLSAEERGRHVYAVGATGTGKTKSLEFFARQDILAWSRSRCGILVLDLEGTLFDTLMNFVAANNLHRWPIVPIDLRRGDRIASYNPLRHRAHGDAGVFIAHAVRGILHAWGQASADETPRLLLWLTIILETLYANGLTLAEAVHLLADARLRRRVTEHAEDGWRRYNLEYLGRLKPDKLREELSSTIHRLNKFVSRDIIKASLCQSGTSLDLLDAIERGSIVLVSLSTKGGLIDQEDARTFGSLLLSDLWTAATMRGKGEEGQMKPFYVTIDEFQEFIGPSLATQLNRARGYGLHLTLAHQFPSQLSDCGDAGKMVLNAVMNNARTKLVFEVEHNEDVAGLSQMLFRQSVNVDEVKHQGYATRVLGHEIKYLSSTSTSGTTGGSSGWQTSHTDGRSFERGEQWSNSETAGYSETTQKSVTDSESDGWSSATSRGESSSDAVGSFSGRSEGEGFGIAAHRIDPSEDSFDERFLEPNTNQSWTRYSADTDGENRSRSAGTSRSSSRGLSGSSGTAVTHGTATTPSRQSSNSHGESASRGVSSADTTGTSGGESWSKGWATTWSPMLMPVLGQEKLPPQFRSVEEQLFSFTQHLAFQPKRHCWVKLIGVARPLPIVIPLIEAPRTTPAWAERWAFAACARTGFIVPLAEARTRQAERHRQITAGFGSAFTADEPATARRPMSADQHGASNASR